MGNINNYLIWWMGMGLGNILLSILYLMKSEAFANK